MQRWILRIVLFLLLVGVIGFAATMLIHYLSPKEGLEAELFETKKMLRQGFDRNKALVKENQNYNDRVNRLLAEGQEKDKEIESLGRQLEEQVAKTRELLAREDREKTLSRIFQVRQRQFRELLESSRGRQQEFLEQFDEQEAFIKKMEDQIELLETELQSLHESTLTEMKATKEEMVSHSELLKAKEAQIDLLKKEKETDRQEIEALKKKITQPAVLTAEPEPERQLAPNPVVSKNESALRREVARQYLSTIEDLLERIEELKSKAGEAPVLASAPKRERGEGDLRKIADLESELAKEKMLRNKDRVTFFFNLGVIYTQYGLYREAADIFEKALKIDTEDAGIHYNIGILYDEHLNDKLKAKEHYEAYLRLAPEGIRRSDVEKWLAMARRFGGRHDDGRARSARGAIEHMFLTSSSGT